MNVLVTGHAGFIGQNMVRALLGAGHGVRGFDTCEGIQEYTLDGIDRVIHLGAISSTTCTDTAALLKYNYYFTVDLINQCSRAGIPIQIASSASVYGTENTTFREHDPVAPKNHYAWSKVLVEEYCNTHSFDIPVQIFRYFNVYGPFEDHKGDQASPIHKFRKSALEHGRIVVFNGSENFKRDFVPVQTIVDTHMKFFDVTESGTWNIGTGKCRSFYDVALEISAETGVKIITVPMPENLVPSYQAFTQADLTKLHQTLRHK